MTTAANAQPHTAIEGTMIRRGGWLKPALRIAERTRSFADVFPIRRLFRAELRRSLQQLRSFLAVEMPHFPIPRVEPELLMLHKLASQLDEIGSLERSARLVFRMIAPGP